MGAATPVIEGLGYDIADYERLLEQIKTEGSQERLDYYKWLYGDGDRDSHFTLEVPFQSYIEASK